MNEHQATNDRVILVDKDDNEVGAMSKLEAHREARLHRAFSVFVCNSRNELLLQKRALDKYHSGGLWTNTCCSHPSPGETVLDAARRRLRQEMGFDCPLREIFTFLYQVDFSNGLTEHELDHVLIGTHEGDPAPNPQEVEAWKWVPLQELRQDISQNPGRYSYWLRICINDPRFEQLLIRAGARSSRE